MTEANPGLLQYVEGEYRSIDCDKWVDHAWCETKGGQIVDLYAIETLSDMKFEYRAYNNFTKQ